jgi:hypothetical protein
LGADLESLSGILKDGTRREILRLLHEHKHLNYASIQDLAGIRYTGRLNYHLKVLGDLIEKSQDGEYQLTERGEAAAVLMLKFPETSAAVDRENRTLYDDAARWAGYGVDCFWAQVVICTLFLVVPIVIMPPMFRFPAFDWRTFMAINAVEWALLSVPSIVLAKVARDRLVLPLRRGELPGNARRWSLAFTALALFFGCAFGIVVMGYADEKVKQLFARSVVRA